MGYYNVDFGSLSQKLLPVRWRGVKMIAWVNVLTIPLTELYNRFINNRNNDLYELSHNSQLCYLQALLNDTFDPINRGIIIDDGPDNGEEYIYIEAEVEPLWLYADSETLPVIIYTNPETELQGPCFIIKIPIAVLYNEAHMRALIDKYRLAGKYYYSIETY